jgi:hypothetical protein
MRKLYFLLILLNLNSISAQNVDSDSSSSYNKLDKIFFKDEQKKHLHILDFYSSIGIESFGPYSGALGYRYYYNSNKLINPGFRLGFWGYKTGQDIPENSSRRSFIYSFSGFMNFPVWKSLSVELSSEMANWISWPTKENTVDDKDVYYGFPMLTEKVSVNSIIYKHYFIDIGFGLIYNTKSTNWNRSLFLSIGFKF